MLPYPEREEWKSIPGYEDRYEVSCCGDVRSLWFKGFPRKRPHVMSPRTDDKGRKVLTLYFNGRATQWHLHVLVLLAFVGLRPIGQEGCHGDGNPANNHVENLRWDTRSANAADAIGHGTFLGDRLGEKHPLSRLTDDAVRIIKSTPRSPGLWVTLAKRFGVSEATVRDAAAGRTWAHVKTNIERAA